MKKIGNNKNVRMNSLFRKVIAITLILISIPIIHSCIGVYFNHPEYSPLFDAIKKNDLSRVITLIKEGENPNHQYPNITVNFGWYYFGETTIFFAAHLGNIEILDYLVKNGAELDATNYYGSNVLMEACSCRQFKIVKYLLEKGMDVNKANKFGQTALSAAVGDYKTDLNEYEIKYDSLTYANMYDDTTIVSLLLSKGANINEISCVKENYLERKQTPLSSAIFTGQYKIVQMLIEHGADVNIPLTDGQPAIFELFNSWQLNNYKIKLLWKLLYKSDKTDAKTKTGDNLVLLLCRCKANQAVAYCLEKKGYPIDYRNNNGSTYLHIACETENLSLIKYLVEKQNVNINVKDNYGSVIAKLCDNIITDINDNLEIDEGNLQIIKYLVGKGLNINNKQPYNKTILDRIKNQDNKVVMFFRELGAKYSYELKE